jgi:pimeloyl-ACP methyl ester carboxylesterase
MRVTRSFAIAAFVVAVSASGAAARPRPDSPCDRPAACSAKAPKPSSAATAAVESSAVRASGTVLVHCDDPPDTLCGSIDVPLDRAHPRAGTIPIFFSVVPHSDGGPALGTILGSAGGPGISSSAEGLFPFLFGSLLDKRDLLTIDLRGTGRSATIDCGALQHGLEDLLDAIRDCGTQLGPTWARYGSADRAEDVEAVRRALGIPMLDYYAFSFGGVDALAYAARHGDHLRTLVLDAPYVTGLDDTFQSPVADALQREARLICRRSPSCGRADRKPLKTLRELLARVRHRPFSGTGLDADGQPHAVTVDETTVVNVLSDDSTGFLNGAEISAAARALERGDRVPLLRLAAEEDFPALFDAGDPRFFSAGDFYATFCADAVLPIDLTAPEATKRAQYDAAVARLRQNAFKPFSVGAWLASFVPLNDACVPWPPASPPPAPVVPPHAEFPSVPTLILTGDLDVRVPSENVRRLATLFPDAQLVQAANIGHVVGPSDDCTIALVTQFVQTAEPVDASCASHFDPFYAVGEFPRRADQALAPPPAPGDASTKSERRVTAMAWAAAYDGIQRFFRMAGDSGVGLRGGTYSVAFNDPAVDLTYHGVRFAGDVAVDGTAHLDLSTGEVAAHLVVDGPRGEDGALDVAGPLFPHTGPLPATGTIEGRHVAVLVPTA